MCVLEEVKCREEVGESLVGLGEECCRVYGWGWRGKEGDAGEEVKEEWEEEEDEVACG